MLNIKRVVRVVVVVVISYIIEDFTYGWPQRRINGIQKKKRVVLADSESVSGPLMGGLSVRLVCDEHIVSLRICLCIRQAPN
jgi:hypothetical protein